MRAREFIFEAAGKTIGRKYQHVEDLVFTNGSVGGLHAVERLRSMATQGGTVETKVDGSPVVYWGRDDSGKFYLFPKNAWQYIGAGSTQTKTGASTVIDSPQAMFNFITGTGNVDPSEEYKRKQFANEMANLWPFFEKASPKKGFVEGGLLFYPGEPFRINNQTRSYDIQPNVTTFHIPVDSDLGKRIKNAKIMVGATGYYTKIGSKEEGRLPGVEKLSTPEVIVLGTTYVETAPNIDTSGLNKVERFIEQNAQLIDNFLAPKPGLSSPGDVIYSYLNQTLRKPGLAQNFGAWAQTKLSKGQQQKLAADQQGLTAVLNAVEMLTNEKMKLIQALSQGTHGGIKQTKPEGYVQAHPGVKFKHDLPGQFIKTIDQLNWAPRRD